MTRENTHAVKIDILLHRYHKYIVTIHEYLNSS